MSDVLELLDSFSAAWNDGDLDRMMAFIADDCVFLGSIGEELDGTTFEGRDAVRAGFAGFLAAFPGGYYTRTDAIVDGERAFVAWTFTHTPAGGEPVQTRGCDLFDVTGGLIRRKDAFRKDRRKWGPPADQV